MSDTNQIISDISTYLATCDDLSIKIKHFVIRNLIPECPYLMAVMRFAMLTFMFSLFANGHRG